MPINSDGAGPIVTIIILTLEAGEYLYFLSTYIPYFYTLSNAINTKLEILFLTYSVLKYYFSFYLAPASVPTNISLLVLGPQSINVTICPPAAINQNGLILSYNVPYTGDPFDTLIQSQSFAVSLSYPATACVNVTLTGLEDFNNYTVSVQAVNSAGSGVSSAGVIARTYLSGS